MRRLVAGVLVCLIGLQPAVARAQERPVPASAASPEQPPASPAPSVESLGMSFERIRRQLRILPASTAKTPLKLEYYVEVQALMPPIPLFKPGELTTGPVPYGAPTHRDMMDHVTPEAFKAGTVPISSLAIMGIVKLLQWEAQRAREERLAKKRQAEIDEERERQRRLKDSLVVGPQK
jgi:hypothetical protein